jgi:threonylcarbamoyladenosine tRNA methylthiotransferase MtaB
MKRRYSKTDYRERLRIIGERIPGVALGTDLITGFPGEGEGDFQETHSFVRDLPLSYLHVFPFSPRAGTPAAEMAERPLPSVVKERLSSLKELDRQKRRDYRTGQLGRVLDTIIEKNDETCSYGTTGNYLKIAVPDRSVAKGSLIFVRPTRIVRDLVESVVVEKP